ncbi:MAG: hypothetical protein JJU07_05715 [Natronohydrobacter sp.]|nr:hypothetical protein [Natronohydrobacter sp.]
MANVTDFIDRATRSLPRAAHADWFLRLPLVLVLLQYGLDKFPLSADAAAGFGLPLALWALAAIGELSMAALLVASGVLRNRAGDVLTRLAGAGTALIIMGVLIVAYWAPPLDLLLFNQFHILLLSAGLYLAFSGQRRPA